MIFPSEAEYLRTPRRKSKRDRRAAAGLAGHLDLSVMLTDDLLDEGQSQPQTFALRGNEIVKEGSKPFLGNAAAGILNHETNRGAVALGSDIQAAPCPHRLQGVRDQVAKYPVEGVGISMDPDAIGSLQSG